MSQNPLNLVFRFVLEILALSAFAYWGWAWGNPWRWPLAIGLPVIGMAVWGIFRAPGDTSANAEAVAAVSGVVRLAIEFIFFGFAAAALLTVHANDRADLLAGILVVSVTIHYALSWDRNAWLLGMRDNPPERRW